MVDVADYADKVEKPWDDEGEQDSMVVPPIFIVIISRGVSPETAADIADGRYADLLAHGDTREDAAAAIDAEFMSFKEWQGVHGG